MNEWTALGKFFEAIWSVFKTPMDLPWIGKTSPLAIMLFLAILGYLIDLVTGILGGKDSE